MKAYYDTGVLLKLYTEEPESRRVREFVTAHAEPLQATRAGLHIFNPCEPGTPL